MCPLPLTPCPYILYGPLCGWAVRARVTAHWESVIVFYIYHETHRAVDRRVCGWKSSGIEGSEVKSRRERESGI